MTRSLVILSAAAFLVVSGCAKKEASHSHNDHSHATARSEVPPSGTKEGHEHTAPHGGTVIVLGAELYHLELVREATTGRLTAYILDGEMENFIRLPAPSFEIIATINGQPNPLRFTAVANPATGETLGDTSQFEAQADWLKTTPTFAATLTSVEIRGTPFTSIPFNFPKGNESR